MISAVDVVSPYKGLAPFEDSDLDALLFFGRSRESEIVAMNIVAARLTVLYGPTGVGKSSLLRAGVTRRLRELAPDADVVVFSAWREDPVASIRSEIAPDVTEGTLAEVVQARDRDLYLVLDQFEEFFLYHADERGEETLFEQLPELVNSDARVNVLLGIREDALAKLDAFKSRLPRLFGNYLRLDHLDREAGRDAILGPLARYAELTGEEWAAEPKLVEAVLDEVAAGKIDIGRAGRSVITVRGRRRRVEAPFLQLVLQRLWELERERGSTTLILDTLNELGGAQKIVEDHLERALAALTPSQQDAAAAMFDHLVTPSGSKIAHRLSDLATYASVEPGTLEPIIGALEHKRILRALRDGSNGGGHYEIYHDVLAEAVLAWRSRFELERERTRAVARNRRLAAVALIAVAGFALMTALAIFALAQRSDARDAADRAYAQELAARALVQLGVDPQRSLELALGATEREPASQTENVLRQALLTARLRRTLRWRGPVSSVAYSPDGGRVLVGRADGVVELRDARSSRALGSLRVGAPLVSAKYAENGSVLAAGGRLVRVRLAVGRNVVLRHPVAVTSASFGRGGLLVITTARDGHIRVWRPGQPDPVRVLNGPRHARFAAMSPNGARVAAVAGDASGHVLTRLYDARTGRLLRTMPQRGVRDALFDPRSGILATASADGTTMLWRARDGTLLHTLDDEGKAVVDATFSPDGSLLATGSRDDGVRVWTVKTGERLFLFIGHVSPVTDVRFGHGGSILLSISEDRTARIWNVAGIEAGREAGLLAGNPEPIVDAEFSPDGKTIVTGSSDGSVRFWDAQLEQRLGIVHNRKAMKVAFASGRIVSTAGSPAAFSADGTTLAAASRGAVVVRVAGRATASFASPATVTAIGIDRDGGELAAGYADGTVRVWDVSDRRLLHTFTIKTPATAIALSPNDDIVGIGGDNGVIQLRSSDGMPLHLLPGHKDRINDLRFDSTGARLVSASNGSNPNVIVWDADTGQRRRVLAGHSGSVTAASFSGDGRWILTAGPIAAAIWQSGREQPFLYLYGPKDLLTDAEWSPDGYRVVTSSRDRTIRTYECVVCRPVDGLVALARTRLAEARTRPATPGG